MKKRVLVGGCFDLLHLGHLIFLENARAQGDELIVLLEPDSKIKKLKGKFRPIYSQKERSYMLSCLKAVDKVIELPEDIQDQDYDKLVLQLKPQIIATTKDDPGLEFKKRSAELVNAQVKEVVDFIPGLSSSKIFAKVLKTID